MSEMGVFRSCATLSSSRCICSFFSKSLRWYSWMLSPIRFMLSATVSSSSPVRICSGSYSCLPSFPKNSPIFLSGPVMRLTKIQMRARAVTRENSCSAAKKVLTIATTSRVLGTMPATANSRPSSERYFTKMP